MKKQILAVALSSLFISGAAFATDLPTGGVITPALCATVGEDVTINTSAGVIGGYSCNTVGNAAAVSTCHTSGSRKTQVYTCTTVDSGPDGTAGTADDIYNSTTCPTGDGSTGSTGEFTITADYKGYVASTTGGGVGGQALLGVCDSSKVNALLPF